MKHVVNIMLIGLSACALQACGGAEKKKDPPPYFYAEEGKTLDMIAPKGINMPDLSNALRIPEVSQPLGEYNPDLVEPPSVIDAADEVTAQDIYIETDPFDEE